MSELVNATLMANLAVEFNVGADILSKGNRTIADKLGAANMTGDTVNVTIMDSGKVIKKSLDLAPLRGTLGVKRGSVPLRVSPIGTAAECSEGELTLAIEKPKVMGKRVANLQDEVNKGAYRGILGSCQPYVANPGNNPTGDAIDRAFRRACFDAEAHTQTSKLSGNIFGMAHPQTWNRVVPSLHANFGNGPKANDLYKNELGDFMGYRFTKGVDTLRFEAPDVAQITELQNGFTINDEGMLTTNLATIDGNAGTEDGEIYPIPMLLTDATAAADGQKHKVQCVDALGKPTGIAKCIYFKWVVDTWNVVPGQGWVPASGHWDLAQPLFLKGPRKNAHSIAYEEFLAGLTPGLDSHGFIDPAYDWYAKNDWNKATGITTELDFTVSNFLVPQTEYLAPMVMFHEDDFLVGIKGLEKMGGNVDSFTVPTEFRDKGIIPWRGTYWTDPYTSLSLFRVDGLMGFGMYQGVSGASIYIPNI